MLSRYLNLPFGLGAIICALCAFYSEDNTITFYWVVGALVCVIAMIGLYFFSDVIDWNWYKTNPPTIDDELRKRLEQRHPFYQQLSQEDKTKFETRLELFIQANEYIPNGWEHVPYDIQAWVAVNPIMITLYKENFLLNKFERVVIYPHSFPSPTYPEQFHCSEVFEEDGVVLFSAEKLLPGVMQPRAYFNIGIYEYAKVFQLMYPDFDYPTMSKIDWIAFEQIVNYTQKKLEEYIGLTDLNGWGVLVTLFFSHPVEMKAKLGEHYERVREILEYEENLI